MAATMKIRPPYLHSTRNGGGDGGYRHDFDERRGNGEPLLFALSAEGHHSARMALEEPDSHDRLADELNRFTRARVVVSYYAHSRLVSLYPPGRWTHIDCTMNKNLHVQNRRGAAKADAPEVLIVNGPSYGNPEA